MSVYEVNQENCISITDMMPEDYLRRYCIVTPQFQSLYQKVFRKYQCPQMMRINFKVSQPGEKTEIGFQNFE